jgi:hypothetical protein
MRAPGEKAPQGLKKLGWERGRAGMATSLFVLRQMLAI